MDKISAALILGIIASVIAGGFIVYDAWSTRASESFGADVIIDVKGQEAELTFDDDTSIKNNSCRKLWLRVKPVYNEAYDDEGYEIISGAIDCGTWKCGDESWYYYECPIDFAQRTEPFIDRLTYNGEEISEGGRGRFRLQVEAVDQEWFVTEPSDGMEAFRIFERSMAIPDRIHL